MKATIKIGLVSVLAMAGTTFLRAEFAFTSNFDGASPWNWDGVVETNSTVSGTDRMEVDIVDGAASSKGYVRRVLDTSGVSDSGGLSLNIGFDLDVSQLTGTVNYKSIRPFELSLNTGTQSTEGSALLQTSMRRNNNDNSYNFALEFKQYYGGVAFVQAEFVNVTEAQREDLHMDIDFSMVEVTPGSNDGKWDLSAVLNVSALGSSVVTDLSLTGQNTDTIHLDDIDGYLFGMVKADNGLDGSAAFDNLSVSVIPEPSSLALLALSGVAALWAARRRVS